MMLGHGGRKARLGADESGPYSSNTVSTIPCVRLRVTAAGSALLSSPADGQSISQSLTAAHDACVRTTSDAH